MVKIKNKSIAVDLKTDIKKVVQFIKNEKKN